MGNISFRQTKRKEQADQQSSKFNQNSAIPESKQEQPLDAWTSEGGFPGNPQNENNKNKSGKESINRSVPDESSKKNETELVSGSANGSALSANTLDTDEENNSEVNSSPNSPAKRAAYRE